MPNVSERILSEVQQLKKAVAHLAGTGDLPVSSCLDLKMLDKAARQFRQLQTKRAQWVSSSDIDKYLKGAWWRTGEFIQCEFSFTAFIKIGRDVYYDKDQLKALNLELKKGNVNLEEFQKLVDSAKFFEREYKKLKEQVRTGKTKKNFVIPDWLRDISSTPIKLPERSVVQADVDQLSQAFLAGGYGEYVDIHKGTHAMLKFIYPYEKYLEAGLRRKMLNWCERFNTATGVLKEITGKKQVCIPVAPADQFEL